MPIGIPAQGRQGETRAVAIADILEKLTRAGGGASASNT